LHPPTNEVKRMGKKINILVLLLIAFLGGAFAQSTEQASYLRLKIYGCKRPLCKLDNETSFKVNDTVMKMEPGKHRIRIWTPTIALIDSTINIRPKDTARYTYRVKTDPLYTKYINEKNTYQQVRNKRLYISPVLMGAAIGAGLIVNKVVAEKQYINAIKARDTYLRLGSQAAIDQQRSDFETYQKKYNNDKKLEYTCYTVSGLLALNYVRLILKQRKTLPPVYKQETLLSSIQFNLLPDPTSKGVYGGLTLKF